STVYKATKFCNKITITFSSIQQRSSKDSSRITRLLSIIMVFQFTSYSSFAAPTSSCPNCVFSQPSMISQPSTIFSPFSYPQAFYYPRLY
ncbi:unnamed protein product, partial [Rotaria sordida]